MFLRTSLVLSVLTITVFSRQQCQGGLSPLVKPQKIKADFIIVGIIPESSTNHKDYSKALTNLESNQEITKNLVIFTSCSVASAQNIALEVVIGKDFLQYFQGFMTKVLFVTFLDRDSTQAIANIIAFHSLYYQIDFFPLNADIVHPNSNYLAYVPLTKKFIWYVINALKLKNLATLSITANGEKGLDFSAISKSYPNLCISDYTTDFKNVSLMQLIARELSSKGRLDVLFLHITKNAIDGLKTFLDIAYRQNVRINTCFWNNVMDQKYLRRTKFHYSKDFFLGKIEMIENVFDYSSDELLSTIKYNNGSLEVNELYYIFYFTLTANLYYLNQSMGFKEFVSLFLELYQKPLTLITFDIQNNVSIVKPLAKADLNSYKKFVQPCLRISCKPGYEPKTMIVIDTDSKKEQNWNCVPCNKGFKKNYGSNDCALCADYYETNIDKTECIDRFQNKCLKTIDAEGFAVTVLSILGSLYSLFVIVTFIFQRKTLAVKTENLTYSIILLVTHTLIFIAIPCLYINEPVLATCSVRHMILGFLFTIVAATTCVKTRKYITIFKLKHRLTNKDKLKATSLDIIIVLALLFFQITLGGALFIHKPPRLIQTLNYESMTRDFQCSTDAHFTVQVVFIGFVLSLSAIQSLGARNLPSFFNETASITYSTWISCIVMGCYFPIYYSARDGKSKAIATSLIMVIVNLSLMIPRFTTRIIIIYFKPKKNTVNDFNLKSG